MAAVIPFLAKVLVPGRLPTSIRRGRLLDLLHQRVSTRLTVLTAGAGYGKTTLLADFADEIEAPVCWLSLDEHDSDLRTFLTYVVASIRQRFPAFGGRLEASLEQPTLSAEHVRALGGALNTDLVSGVSGGFLLVIDDLHVLPADSLVWGLLDEVLSHPPEKCHLVLASREPPRLRTLSRLLVHGQASLLQTADLRFTEHEVVELLQARCGGEVPEEVKQQALECEGWAAGLVLSGVAPAGLVLAEGNGREWLFNYLASDVLAAQDQDTRDFLLATSVLPGLRADICNALLDRRDAAGVLDRLAGSNLFLVPLQTEGERWYRYHALFREFLGDTLRRESPWRLDDLHRSAAALAEARGDWGTALYHVQEVGSPGLLVALLERCGADFFRHGRWPELHRAFELLPTAAIDCSLDLLLLRARLRLRAGELLGAEADARNAGNLALKTGSVGDYQLALAYRASALRLQGNVADALALAEEAVSSPGATETGLPCAEALKQAGMCHGTLGNLERSVGALQKSLAIFRELGDADNQASVADQLGMAYMAIGDLDAAERHYVDAERLWRGLGNHVALARTLNNLGNALYLCGDYANAKEKLAVAARVSAQSGYTRMHAYSQASLADLYRDTGDHAQAEQAYQSAAELAAEAQEESLIAYLLNARGELLRLRGDLVAAGELSARAVRLASARANTYEQGVYETSLAIVECEKGDLENALERLDRSCSILTQCGARRELARALFQKARAYFVGRMPAGALQELEQVVAIVGELGYDGFLRADVQSAPMLIQYVASKHVGGEIVQRWAANLGNNTPQEPRRRVTMATAGVFPPVEALALGQAEAVVGDRVVSAIEWRSAGSRKLFFYLLTEGRWLRKEEIIDTLWPELDPARSESSFHSNAYRLRRALFKECLQYERGRFRLNPAVEFSYDVADFERLVAEGDRLPAGAERAARFRDAIALYRGPFLDEFYSEWCETKRRALETRYVHALSRLASYLMERGEYRRASELWERALTVDAYQEDALRKLMLCHSQAGDRSAALRQYHDWREIAQRDGIRPTAETQDLYQALMNGHDILPVAVTS